MGISYPNPPPLATLNQQSSWHNRAHHIDRSACIELRASEVWPYTNLRAYRRRSPGLEAFATFTITAHKLHELHNKRLPFQLIGDHRTAKSNAMKSSTSPPSRGRAQRRPGYLHSNPNRGASRTKILGLWYDWTQTLRIERHRLHERLAQHFFICPDCKHKFRKLFMPLCTEAEARDADLAEDWLNLLEEYRSSSRRPLPPDLMQYRAQLTDRYGILFLNHGRRLLCRNCLNLSYGQVR